MPSDTYRSPTCRRCLVRRRLYRKPWCDECIREVLGDARFRSWTQDSVTLWDYLLLEDSDDDDNGNE